ncbi:predicted protein [Pyrenophora tritici-repentis Pt-1C-BFP]|uniref:Uncharacterized protein n=1 Tax=Pyrenophora tritici-repentis (strain Pt-1C-BFP) TaxID=426418 RepID=B2VWS7_PYRTR|nr:uncharacterized protein PTRG_01639 [Pyrenophora tritici-repentis Pt-1C-BFP]EDU41077.1 predicted protein [Pyrenophora tritici-repentis Pt-1C-BFP]
MTSPRQSSCNLRPGTFVDSKAGKPADHNLALTVLARLHPALFLASCLQATKRIDRPSEKSRGTQKGSSLTW